MSLIHGTVMRSKAAAMILTFALALAAFAPGSPFVASARAAMACDSIVWGARNTPTSLWAQGLVTCSGTVGGGGMQLLSQRCIYDVIGACLYWGDDHWLGDRTFFGPGSWYLTKTGSAQSGSIYHIVMFSHVQSTATGAIYEDTNTTTQWRQ
jgi:hypothetical protein